MKRTRAAVAASVGVVALTTFLLVLNETVPTVPTLTLAWDDDPGNAPGSFTTEVWATTNLSDWQLRTNVATNRVTLPRDKPAEFFKIRNRGTNGLLSDWCRKTNL